METVALSRLPASLGATGTQQSAAERVEQKAEETLSYYGYPAVHWRQIRTARSSGLAVRSADSRE